MAFGDDAQNTWDKMSDDHEDPAQQGSDTGTPADSPDSGFREHIGQQDSMLSGDMIGDMKPEKTPKPDNAEAEEQSYDADMKEPMGDAFTDQDSF